VETFVLTLLRKGRIILPESNGHVKRGEKGLPTPDTCVVAFIEASDEQEPEIRGDHQAFVRRTYRAAGGGEPRVEQ
jgi:hypothetical protein